MGSPEFQFYCEYLLLTGQNKQLLFQLLDDNARIKVL